mmetsp:Transcript_64402/g.122045  ORF Transcript_64402/g.122045 Transcript_64402/m.122045 type:complete len:89 (-) Transcript_64402:88-354(-)
MRPLNEDSGERDASSGSCSGGENRCVHELLLVREIGRNAVELGGLRPLVRVRGGAATREVASSEVSRKLRESPSSPASPHGKKGSLQV